jgi:four helix bundle protein
MPAKSARPAEPAEPTPAVVAENAPAAPAAPETTPAATAPAPAQPQYGYRGLKVWQRAMDLATAMFAVTRGIHDQDDVLSTELRRTAIAIPAHIATGNSLYQRTDYVEHLSTAHGQVSRLECLLQIAERLGYLPTQDTAPLLSLAADVGRMLRGLARALAPTREAEPEAE